MLEKTGVPKANMGEWANSKQMALEKAARPLFLYVEHNCKNNEMTTNKMHLVHQISEDE